VSEQFLLPDLGEGLTEAEIVSWLVAPGDVIVVDQPVVEVESAKSIVELPSPYAGRVETLHAAQGEVVQKGSPLLTIAATAGMPGGAEEDPSPELVPGTALRSDAQQPGAGSGAVLIGYGTRESTMKLKRPEGGRFGRSAAAVAPAVATAPAADSVLHVGAHRSPVISPLVRRYARDHGIDPSQLVGSRTDSLVRREDVDAAISARGPAAASGSAAASGAELRIPITGLRKLVGERLSQSRSIIPEATIWLDVDATELMLTRERLQKKTGERFSLTTLIARFVVSGLKQYPVLNSSVDEGAQEIVQHAAINLGLAAQTPRGLMVPVVHGAQDLTTTQLRDAIAALVAASEKGNYAPAALAGGTFTLNNYGAFGVDGSTPIINYPEVAMLGIGRVMDRPWVVDGQLAVRKVVTLSFVFDHRVCDGDVASGFLTYVARCVEEPLLLLSNV
jgi:2-oxoisovalerate dehydrogenase E2 component (dihydrolipoyl transacylase)